MQKTTIILGTATPGGGFPLFGDALAAAITETDPTFHIETSNTKGSAENIPLLEDNKLDIALVAGEPAYEALAGIGRPITSIKIITAIYSNPGMFAVKGDSSYTTIQSLVGQPIAWGTRDSGLTLLARYVMDGLDLIARRTPSELSDKPATAPPWCSMAVLPPLGWRRRLAGLHYRDASRRPVDR